MSILQFSHSGTSENTTKFVGESRQFQITIDEPPALGGKDEAANPVEYTLASLAGCLNVVAHLIAKELEIEIHSLKINVEGDLDPGKLLTGDATQRAGFTDIRVKLDVESNAEPELLRQWLAVVRDRCPVTDNLANPTNVEIVL
ncbi:MAG: OsmC family protein [Bacteroidetes bacterium]|nr:OsmC family protein [Bacteroidota bacterium]